MALWTNFYILTGGASATLMGLMFISITFGAKLVTKETVGFARSILSPIIYHFAHVFIIASMALIPITGFLFFGWVIILSSISRLCWLPIISRNLKRAHAQRHDIEFSDWAFGVFLPALVYLSLITFGIFLLEGNQWPLYGVAISLTTLLILGVFSAWDMLIWMALVI